MVHAALTRKPFRDGALITVRQAFGLRVTSSRRTHRVRQARSPRGRTMFRPRPSDADGRLVQGRARAALRRFRQDQAGAYAVEFALLATPFLALLFGIFEVGLGILTAASLETAVANASRQI